MSPIHASRSLWTSAAAGYTGPGDVVSGALAWWGLRAYTSASIGANAVRLREDGGNTEQDFPTIAGGGLNLASIASFKGANNLFVVKLYDQVGTNHFVQATAGNQPKFILNAIGSLPAMQDTGASGLNTTGPVLNGQPFTFSSVYEVQTTNDGFIAIGAGNAFPQFGPNRLGAANSVHISTANSDPAITATASDGAWHAVQGVFNDASSDMNVDGSANTGTATNDGQTNVTISMFSFNSSSFFLLGYIGELGFWNSAFSGANSTAMSANQHSYWGF